MILREGQGCLGVSAVEASSCLWWVMQSRGLTGVTRIMWPEAVTLKVPDVRRHFTVLHGPDDSCPSF